MMTRSKQSGKPGQGQFASERTRGEWFSCSPSLAEHIIQTWVRNNALPREHQVEVMLLQQRIDALLQVREIMGGAPDMVNPSISEPGKVTS
jgi:hypothetical protein